MIVPRKSCDSPRIDDVGVVEIDGNVSALKAAHPIPVLQLEFGAEICRATRQRDGLILVLLCTVHPVRKLVVNGDSVHLRRRLVQLRRPALAAVERDVSPTVVRLDHDVRVMRIHPKIMLVPVWNIDGPERFSPVDRLEEIAASNVNRVLVLRVGKDVHVVPGPTLDTTLLVDPAERCATVVRTEHTALLCFDDRPHSL